jgi:hypothetical protein
VIRSLGKKSMEREQEEDLDWINFSIFCSRVFSAKVKGQIVTFFISKALIVSYTPSPII